MIKISSKDRLDNILKFSSLLSRKSGEILFNENKVLNFTEKNIDNIFHLYANVVDNINNYSTHIKFNHNDKVLGVRCNCNQFEENSKYIKNYICPHIMATTYTVYGDLNKDKILNKYNKTDLRTLDLRLRHVLVNKKEEYNLELKILGDTLTSIDSLGKFLLNPIYNFKENDLSIIKLLRRKLKKDNTKIISKRIFRLEKDELNHILELVDDKKISLNYDEMNYISKVYKEDIPLIFTLKVKNDLIVLTTQKKKVVPLDDKKIVWLYDKKIYIPSKKQLKYYDLIYKQLNDKGYLAYRNNNNNLKNILFILNNISKEIIMDEAIKNKVNSLKLVRFNIGKDKKIFCKVNIENITNFTSSEDDKIQEKISMELEKYKFIKGLDRYDFIGNDEDEYKFLTTGIKGLKNLGEVNLLKGFNDVNIINSSNIKGMINQEDDKFEFNFKIDGLEYSEFKDVLNRINDKSSFYKTKSNSFLDLEDSSVIEFFKLIEDMNLFNDSYEEKSYIDKFDLLHIESKIKNNKLTCINLDENVKILIDRLKNKSLLYKVPKDLNANLRDYQIEGYNFMRSLIELGFGGILADDMGLGKTIQTISLILSLKDKGCLIVVPTSVIYNWENEFKKFAPTLSVGIIHGNLDKRNKIKEKYNDFDVILTTYGTLRSDFSWYKDNAFDVLIIDEAQNIKNKNSKITKMLNEIDSKTKIALTGTPIENNMLELWSIFNFIMPSYLYSEDKFKREFVNNNEKIEELRLLIAPFILRRLKEDVLEDLKEKIEKRYLVDMTENQKNIYNSYINQIRYNLKHNKKNKIQIFAYLTKLRQLCLDPSLLVEDFNEDSGKIKVVLEILDNIKKSDKKIIIFSQFTTVLKKIAKKIEDKELEYLYLDGSTKAKDRLSLADEFNNGEKNIFLISLKAGGVGLNLTSANIVLHFDPWWNPAVEDQATDRAHRIGQKNVVEVIKLIAKDSIEEKILKLQEDKKELIRMVIDEGLSNNLDNMNEDELLELFNL